MKMLFFSEIIDQLLKEYDKDDDGFLSFSEFSIARSSINKS